MKRLGVKRDKSGLLELLDEFDAHVRTDKREYQEQVREIGAAYRELIGDFGVAMTAVQVAALMEDRAKIEIEVTAVVPD